MYEEFTGIVINLRDPLGRQLPIKVPLIRTMFVNSKLKNQEQLNVNVTYVANQDIMQINVDPKMSTENVLRFTKNWSYHKNGI